MTIIEQINQANDRLALVRSLANAANRDLNKSEALARMARQKLSLSVMTAIDNALVRITVDDGKQWRGFNRDSAIRAALKLYPACEAPDDGKYPDMSEEECRDWTKAIAELLFPTPKWMPDSGFKKAEASAAQLHELEQLDKARAATKRAAKLAFLLIARGVHVTDYSDTRGFLVNRDHFFPAAIRHKGSLITQYDVISSGEGVYMTPSKYGMVKIAARLNLGSDGTHDYIINATVDNLEKAAQHVKARNESDDLAAALKLVKDLAVDRKFTVAQRELVNAAIVKLTAIKAAWDEADRVASGDKKPAEHKAA